MTVAGVHDGMVVWTRSRASMLVRKEYNSTTGLHEIPPFILALTFVRLVTTQKPALIALLVACTARAAVVPV